MPDKGITTDAHASMVPFWRVAARRAESGELMHGVPVADPYRWLEDPTSAETREWIRRQDDAWRSLQHELPDQQRWRDRVARFIDFPYQSAPVWRGDRRFVMRRAPGATRSGLYTRAGAGAECDLLGLLPVNLAGRVAIRGWHPSPTGKFVTFAISVGGTDDALLYVVDLESSALVGGPIDGGGHTSLAWRPSEDAFYYSRLTRGGGRTLTCEILLHRIGTPTDSDLVVPVPDGAAGRYVTLSSSRDGAWLAVSASDGSGVTGNALWLGAVPASAPQTPRFLPVQAPGAGNTGLSFGRSGRIYALTNRDAPTWRIMLIDPGQPWYENWRELITADPDAVITDFAELWGSADDSSLLVAWRRDMIGQLTEHDLDTGARLHDVVLPGIGRLGPLSTAAGRRDGQAWFSYSSPTTPPQVLTYRRGSARVGAPPADPGGGWPAATVQSMSCTSADGTPVTMILVRPSGASGPRPTILTGYGGFGVTSEPSYSPSAVAWVESGGYYVTAGVRGGGEHGLRWHEAGRGHRKQKAIDDIIAAARHLIDIGLAVPSALGLLGGSNGGLLAGAALTQHPELFAAAVCVSPLLDMVRYERSGLGLVWRAEYGSADIEADFRCLLAYSPYHQVVPGRCYPATLFMVASDDERVDPMHARKMCAALQFSSSGTGPIAFRQDPVGGHLDHVLGLSADLTGDALAFLAQFASEARSPDLRERS
jgi:prolyl oligopeptidase